MAYQDKYENELLPQANITMDDYVRMVDSLGVSSKNPITDVAKAFIETYTGSTLNGSSTSVKSAIDTLGSLVSAHTTSIAANASNITGLDARVTTNAANITDLHTRVMTDNEFTAIEELLGIGGDE